MYKTVLAAVLALSAPVALAQLAPLPAPQTQGNVTFLSGGVGESQQDAMKQIAPQYPLELVFAVSAKPRDMYTADVGLRITDRGGNVVMHTDSAGPIVLAKLPPGRYTITARRSASEAPKSQTISLTPGEHERVVFMWSEPLAAR